MSTECEVIPAYKRDFTDDIGDWFANKFKSAKQTRLRNKFAMDIRNIIEIANANKAKGVRLGDQAYVELYSQALAVCNRYCNDSASTLDSVLNNAPAIRELKAWAEYNPATDVIGKFITYSILTIIVVTVIGALAGYGYDIFHWVSRLSQHG